MKKSKCHDFLEMQPKGLEGHGCILDPQNFSSLLFSSRVAGDHTLLLQDPRASPYGFHGTINSMVIKEMYLEEFPSVWCFFSFHAIQQMHMSEVGCLGILRTFRTRGRRLCSIDSRSVNCDSGADEVCCLSSAQSQCRDFVNAQISWHVWQINSNSDHMGLE